MKKLLASVLALAMALSMVAVATAEDAGTIKIGVIGPMTGAAATYGTAVANGAKIAADEINALGGVQLELLVQSAGGRPNKELKQMTRQAQKLLEQWREGRD